MTNEYNSCDNFIANMCKPNVSTNFKLNDSDLATNIDNSEPENNLILYPNPSSGKIQIHSENLVINGV